MQLQNKGMKEDFDFIQNPEVCQLILEIALGHPIPKVKVHAEHTVLYSSDFKSIRLDVYGEDEVDVRYDLESQNEKKNLPKRSRYYQSARFMTW